MLNLMPMPNCVEQLKGKVSFSNYQIVVEKKYEKAVILFNDELENHLLINEDDFCYTFEFIYNKTFTKKICINKHLPQLIPAAYPRAKR